MPSEKLSPKGYRNANLFMIPPYPLFASKPGVSFGGRNRTVIGRHHMDKLFIGDIPKVIEPSAVKTELRVLFPSASLIECYDEPNLSPCSPKNRGFAFVHFYTTEEAKKAKLKFQTKGLVLFGIKLRLDFAFMENQVPDGVMKQVTVLYVRNVHPTVSESQLCEFMGGAKGGVNRTKIMTTFAFVHYDTREQAEKALETRNGVVLNNQILSIEWSRPPQESSKFDRSDDVQYENSVAAKQLNMAANPFLAPNMGGLTMDQLAAFRPPFIPFNPILPMEYFSFCAPPLAPPTNQYPMINMNCNPMLQYPVQPENLLSIVPMIEIQPTETMRVRSPWQELTAKCAIMRIPLPVVVDQIFSASNPPLFKCVIRYHHIFGFLESSFHLKQDEAEDEICRSMIGRIDSWSKKANGNN